jgi:di/tripeptidase
VDEKEMDRLRRICKAAVERATGITPRFESSSTDCNIPLSMGIPAICVGTYAGGGAHTREEYVEIDSLPGGMEVAIRTVSEIAEVCL